MGHLLFKGYAGTKPMNFNQSVLSWTKIMAYYPFPRPEISGSKCAERSKAESRLSWSKGKKGNDLILFKSRSRACDITRNGKVYRLRRWPEVLYCRHWQWFCREPTVCREVRDKLAKTQRRLARTIRGSNDRQIIKTQIESIHVKVNHQRDDS